MSSSLLEILALMEQAITEKGQSSSNDGEVAYISQKKRISGRTVKSKDILDVDKIVRLIYDQSKKDYKNTRKEPSFKTLRDVNQSNIQNLTNSQQILEAIASYFIPPVTSGDCSNLGQLLTRALVNQAYQYIIDPNNFDPSAGGFENEKLMAYLLGGTWVTTKGGGGDIADVRVGEIGISLKTKKPELTVGGSYKNLLTTLGINSVEIKSNENYPTAIQESNVQAEYRTPRGGKTHTTKLYSQLTPRDFKNPKPIHTGGLFYVAFVKKEESILLKVWQVTQESAMNMVQESNKGLKNTIFEFTTLGLSDVKNNSFLGKKMSEVNESTLGVAEGTYVEREIVFSEIKDTIENNNEEIYPQLRDTLNTLNTYMGLMVDSITNYSVNPNTENLKIIQKSLEQMSGFTIDTQENCQSSPTQPQQSQQAIQEAFSVPKADLTKNGYDGSPHPAAIWQDRQILDNIDLNKFKDMAVKSALRDGTKSASQLKAVASRMEQLVAVIPAIPEQSRDEYVKDLFALIDSIYAYWKDRNDGTWFLSTFTDTLRSFRNPEIDALTNKHMEAAELSDEEMEARQKAHDAALAAQAEKEQEAGLTSITSPTFKTSRLPGNLEDYNAVMDRMFGNSDSLRERVLKLSQLATLFGGSEKEIRAKIDKMSNLDFMSKVVMMDYLVEVAKSFDSTAGRYLLEYLLAVVAKGRVTGADLGKTGLANAVDFRSSSGEFGSSKFLSSYDDAKQSVDAFKEGEKVTYVVAVREGNPRRLNNDRAPAPLDLQSIKMHIFDITKTGSSFDIEVDKESGGKDTVKLGRSDFGIKTKGKITHLNIGKIAEANQSNAFTIPLVFTTEEGTKTYRQMLSSELAGNKKELLAVVKDLFDELKKADEMSRKYVVTGKPQEGGKAMDSLDSAGKKLGRISNYEGYEKIS